MQVWSIDGVAAEAMTARRSGGSSAVRQSRLVASDLNELEGQNSRLAITQHNLHPFFPLLPFLITLPPLLPWLLERSLILSTHPLTAPTHHAVARRGPSGGTAILDQSLRGSGGGREGDRRSDKNCIQKKGSQASPRYAINPPSLPASVRLASLTLRAFNPEIQHAKN